MVNTRGGSNKEYVIRIYRYFHTADNYSLICWNGKIGNRLIPQPKHSNCPHDAYLKWMLATGQITRYDPKKHKKTIIPEKVDEDLKKLEDLVK